MVVRVVESESEVRRNRWSQRLKDLVGLSQNCRSECRTFCDPKEVKEDPLRRCRYNGSAEIFFGSVLLLGCLTKGEVTVEGMDIGLWMALEFLRLFPGDGVGTFTSRPVSVT